MSCPPPLERSLLRPPIPRGLKHLTVDVELVTPRRPLYDREHPVTCAIHARDVITAVCLALTSTSKIEQLTIKVTFEDSQASDADLAEIMWPLIFLRTDVVVKVEGISEVLQRETSGDYEQRARQRALL